jgi:hypothetical protein
MAACTTSSQMFETPRDGPPRRPSRAVTPRNSIRADSCRGHDAGYRPSSNGASEQQTSAAGRDLAWTPGFISPAPEHRIPNLPRRILAVRGRRTHRMGGNRFAATRAFLHGDRHVAPSFPEGDPEVLAIVRWVVSGPRPLSPRAAPAAGGAGQLASGAGPAVFHTRFVAIDGLLVVPAKHGRVD